MSPSSGHVLVVGHGDGLGQRLRVLSRAARSTLLAGLDRPVTDAAAAEFDEVCRGDLSDPRAAVLAAREVHRRHPVTRVVQFGEHALVAASQVALDLGVPGPPAATAALVTDKLRMRRALARAGLDATGTWAVPSELPDLDAVGPVVVKPRGSCGSRGVTVVRRSDELAAAVEHAEQYGEEVRGVMIESFHGGPLYSVDCVSEHGRHLTLFTSQEFVDPDTFVELGYVMPAPIEPDRAAALVSCAHAALDALGVTDGASHTEIVWSPDGPRLIETHLRPAADRYVQLVQDMLHVDLVDVLLRQQLGHPVLDEVRTAVRTHGPGCGAAAVWFASPAAPGRVVKVLQPAGGTGGDVEVCRIDEDFVGTTDNLARVANVLVRADSPATALAQAQRAAGGLRFVLVVDAATTRP